MHEHARGARHGRREAAARLPTSWPMASCPWSTEVAAGAATAKAPPTRSSTAPHHTHEGQQRVLAARGHGRISTRALSSVARRAARRAAEPSQASHSSLPAAATGRPPVRASDSHSARGQHRRHKAAGVYDGLRAHQWLWRVGSSSRRLQPREARASRAYHAVPCRRRCSQRLHMPGAVAATVVVGSRGSAVICAADTPRRTAQTCSCSRQRARWL